MTKTPKRNKIMDADLNTIEDLGETEEIDSTSGGRSVFDRNRMMLQEQTIKMLY